MSNAHPFNDSDWHTWPNANGWPGTAEEDEGGYTAPVARRIGVYDLVADPRGADAVDEETNAWGLELPFPTQAAAAAFLNGLPETFDPPAYGFTRY